MRRDFKKVDLRLPLKAGTGAEMTGIHDSPSWMTAEQIPVMQNYTASDLAGWNI